MFYKLKKKMNKNFFIAAAVVATMASCSKSELTGINPENSNAIKFSPYAGKVNRAVQMGHAELQAQGFKVYSNIEGAAFGTFMPGLKITHNNSENTGGEGTAGTGEWGYTGTPYNWISATTNIEFFAFSTKNDLNADTNGLIKPTIAATAAEQEDIFVSEKESKASGQVDFTFKHVLSQVDFQVATGAGVEVEISSFEIQNVATVSADLDLKTGDFTTPTTLGNYTYGANESIGLQTVNQTSGSLKFSTLGDGTFMLLPQTITPWVPADNTTGARIRLSYKLKYDGVYVLGATTAVDAYFPLANPVGDWKKGTKYLYNLSLVKGGGAGSDIDGNPLLDSSPILFGVAEIDDWGLDQITPLN